MLLYSILAKHAENKLWLFYFSYRILKKLDFEKIERRKLFKNIKSFFGVFHYLIYIRTQKKNEVKLLFNTYK